jgi:glycosyltransferase involved in cell wall biosynthesis
MSAARPLRLLALNWRDPANPEAGGAETHLHEILRRWVAAGSEVTLLAAGFPEAEPEIRIDGVRVLRAGSWWNANFALAWRARRLLKAEPFDAVVEDVNKIPFFLPLLSRLPHLLLIPHLFGETVFRETNVFFGAYVFLFELFIPRVYRRSRVIAISPSTREDLIRRGLAAERVAVSYCGFEAEPYDLASPPPRPPVEAGPRLVHLGRLRRYKGADLVLRSFVRIREALPEARLDIVGDGPEFSALQALAKRLGLGASVVFHGHLPLERMVDLLYRSHLFLNASPKEGWGLTVVEAGACGLPTVAANSPGLRDSVVDRETGILVPYGDAPAMAEAALSLLRDPQRLAAMGERAARRARSFDWDRTAREAREQLDLLLAERPAEGGTP